jgi:hypothetical protein
MQVSSAMAVVGIAAAEASIRATQKYDPFLSSECDFINGMFYSPLGYRLLFLFF